MTDTYRSSKGDLLIADMNFPHLKNAKAKLERTLDGVAPDTLLQERAELEAIDAELIARDERFRVENAGQNGLD